MADTQRTPTPRTSRLDFLTDRVPGLFLVATVFFAVFALFNGLEAFAGTEPAGFAGALGWVFAFLAILGLYPVLVEQSEGWATAAATFAGVGAIGAAINGLGGLGEALGLWGSVSVVAGVGTTMTIIGILPGFISVGVAALRADVLQRRTSLWLFAPAAVFLVNLLALGLFARGGAEPPAAGAFVLSSLMTLALFANFLTTRASDRIDGAVVVATSQA